jgi:hypothetical protein
VQLTLRLTCGRHRRAPCRSCKARDGADRQVQPVVRKMIGDAPPRQHGSRHRGRPEPSPPQYHLALTHLTTFTRSPMPNRPRRRAKEDENSSDSSLCVHRSLCPDHRH